MLTQNAQFSTFYRRFQQILIMKLCIFLKIWNSWNEIEFNFSKNQSHFPIAMKIFWRVLK